MRDSVIQPGPMNRKEEYEICPYNPAHTILQHRMQTHLIKCRNNYPSSDFVICDFDATHHVLRPEIEYHRNHCRSRINFDKFMYKQNDAPVLPVVSVPNVVEVPASEENWDDSNFQGYDPNKNADKKNVLRSMSCKPPSERKAFRREERERIRMLEEEAAAKGPIKDKEPAKPKPQNSENLEPLRRPRESPQAYLNWARGARVGNDFPTISPGQQAEVGAQAPRVPEWMGLGRGRAQGNPPAPPKQNPWGRGQPSF